MWCPCELERLLTMASHSQDDDGEEELYGADAEDEYVEHAYGLLGNVGERGGGGVGCDVEAVRSSLDGLDAAVMQNEEIFSPLGVAERRKGICGTASS